jgi:drug/metabolite transporter (DMT)-like permease
MAEIDWRRQALVATMGTVAMPPMPLRSASNLTFFYALGYPIGALAVSAMSPMAVLVFRFGLAGAILSAWALIARVTWPTGRTLAHVVVTGLLTQALQFICLYLALLHGAPAVLGAVIISMNPVVTALLAAAFLGEVLTWTRVGALVLGVVAVSAACAGRLLIVGGVDTVVLLLIVALLSLAAGGVYQQRFCSGVDFRVTSALQNAVALLPVAVLATGHALHRARPVEGGGRRRGRRTAQRHLVHDALRARHQQLRRRRSRDAVRGHPRGRGSAVVVDVGSAARHRHRDRPHRRRGGVLAQRVGVASAASAFDHIADGVHHAGKLDSDIRACRLIDEFRHPARVILGDPIVGAAHVLSVVEN